MLLLENHLPIESITVMVQKEAGQRLCAEVGTRDSGAITVGVNYYGTAKQLFNVSRGNFMPSPNVDSVVIRIDLNQKYKLQPDGERFFFKVIKAGFSQRRKTLANTLSSQVGISKETVYSVLKENELSENIRIESMNMEQLIKFSETLRNKI